MACNTLKLCESLLAHRIAKNRSKSSGKTELWKTIAIAMWPAETPKTKDLGRRYRTTCDPITALSQDTRIMRLCKKFRVTTDQWRNRKESVTQAKRRRRQLESFAPTCNQDGYILRFRTLRARKKRRRGSTRGRAKKAPPRINR